MGACGDRAWKDHRKNKYSGKCSNKGVLEIPRGESVKGEEGLEQILHLRGRRMRTKKEGRERAEEKTKGTREPDSRGVRRGDSNTNMEMQFSQLS